MSKDYFFFGIAKARDIPMPAPTAIPIATFFVATPIVTPQGPEN
jgi:hypothetical protein